jgi:hypothetical protein
MAGLVEVQIYWPFIYVARYSLKAVSLDLYKTPWQLSFLF